MKQNIQIPYRTFDEYEPVDIEQLRPQGSYENLIKKRSYPIDNVVKNFSCIPNEFLINRSCPTCGSNKACHELTKDHLEIVRCKVCDLVYVNPVFNESHYQDIYRSAEYQEIVKNLGENSHIYRKERFGKERISIIKQFINPGTSTPKYLDVGCSTGFVVEAACELGFDAIGIDPNPSAVKYGKDLGLNLYNDTIEEAGFSPEYFDAVSLFDVIEHLRSPADMLTKAISFLKPNGIIFLYVPNYDSASRILLGDKAHFIWPTHHLNYYTLSTISDLMKRMGLKIEMMMTEGLDIMDYIWYQREVEEKDITSLEKIKDQLQFFINAGGYGKNLRVLARKSS